MTKAKARREKDRAGPRPAAWRKSKFELTGCECLEKRVSVSGACGRVYLPLGWLGKRVKVIRLD